MSDILVPGHGTWVLVGKEQELEGEKVRPDITKDLAVGDLIKIVNTKDVSFQFHPFESNYNEHTCSLVDNFDLKLCAHGFVLKTHKFMHSDTMMFGKNNTVNNHNNHYYTFEAFITEEHSCRVLINSESLIAALRVYKWVEGLVV